MDNWEDMLEDDNDIEIKKEGENFDDEVVEEIKQLEVIEKKPKAPTQKIKKKPGKKRKKGKKVNLDFSEPVKEMTYTEKEKLENEIKKNQEKEIANMFGIETNQILQDTKLTKENDYIEFAKLLSQKLENPYKTNFLTKFLKTVISEIEENQTIDDLTELRDKINLLIKKKNNEKKKNKAKNKVKGIKVSRDNDFGLYDDYQMEGDMGDEYDYDGKDDDYDFM